jgi:hypothetical protein
LLLGVVALAAWVPHLYRQVDEHIRCRIEERLASHYPHLGITVRSAELIDGEGIILRDVLIVEPNADGPHPELVHWEEVVLSCQSQITDLLQKEPQVTRVVIRRPTLRMTRRRDGTWSTAQLLPVPQFSDTAIETRIENGTIEVVDPLRNPASTWTMRDVNLVLSPVEPAADGTPRPRVRRVQGSCTADHAQRVELDGLVDFDRQTCSIGGSLDGLSISPDLHASMPGPLAEPMLALSGLRGDVDVKFQVQYDPAAPQPLEYQVSGKLARGRLDDGRLPHPLIEMRCGFRVSNQGLAIDELTARSNRATLRLNYHQAGFAPNSAKRANAEIRGLELDRRVLAVLPVSLQDQWYKYRPAGTIDADATLLFDGAAWHPQLLLRTLNLSFSHYKFPYRLDEGKGTLTLQDDKMSLNMTAYSNNQPVRLAAEVVRPGPEATGWMEARGEALEIDDKLLAAVPDKSRPVLESLHPRGSLEFYLKMWRDQPAEPLHKHLLLTANRCSVQFDKFPYPIRNIRGRLEMFDDTWSFRNLEGNNDTAQITCEGQFAPSMEGIELRLNFVGRDVPLDTELRDALRPAEKQVWMAFRPRGVIDLVADVRYLTESKKLSVSVRAEPQADSTAIEPVHFPYRLERLRGVLHYRDGQVTLERIKAEHGLVRLSTGGSCDFTSDGRWKFRLENLTVDRLRLDRDLIPALPDRLKRALVSLKPNGPLSIRGAFELESGELPGDPLQSRWDITLGFQQCSLDCGVRLDNLSGAMTLQGGFDGQRLLSRGELALDSLVCRNVQVTEINGPVWIDDQQILLGGWVARRVNAAAPGQQGEALRSVTGRLYGGTLQGDGWISLGAEPKFGLHAELTDADAARCAQELMPGQQDLRGTLSGIVDLRGGRSANALAGRGTVQLRDADVYELPFMVALLKLLSIRAPDNSAFSKSDANFRIEGEHIYFDQLDFNGDAISMLGKGEMDFQQNIKLTFHAIVGRGELSMPVVRELFSGAAKQFLLIHVGGNLQNPEMRREAFPGVNQALQQLQAERRMETDGTPTAARVRREGAVRR